jgi:hypothetical protein
MTGEIHDLLAISRSNQMSIGAMGQSSTLPKRRAPRACTEQFCRPFDRQACRRSRRLWRAYAPHQIRISRRDIPPLLCDEEIEFRYSRAPPRLVCWSARDLCRRGLIYNNNRLNSVQTCDISAQTCDISVTDNVTSLYRREKSKKLRFIQICRNRSCAWCSYVVQFALFSTLLHCFSTLLRI